MPKLISDVGYHDISESMDFLVKIKHCNDHEKRQQQILRNVIIFASECREHISNNKSTGKATSEVGKIDVMRDPTNLTYPPGQPLQYV